MKAYLALISAAVIGLAACSQEAANLLKHLLLPLLLKLLLQKLLHLPMPLLPLKLLQPMLPPLLLPATAQLLLKPTTLCSSTLKKSK